MKFGITEIGNPKDHAVPIEQVLIQMTDGGVDYAFECCGVPSCMVYCYKAIMFSLIQLSAKGNLYYIRNQH